MENSINKVRIKADEGLGFHRIECLDLENVQIRGEDLKPNKKNEPKLDMKRKFPEKELKMNNICRKQFNLPHKETQVQTVRCSFFTYQMGQDFKNLKIPKFTEK